jgi:hypothetical protein
MKSELLAGKPDVDEETLAKIKDYIQEALQITDSTALLGVKLRVAVSGYSIACKIPALKEYRSIARSILQETYSTLRRQNRTNPSDLQRASELLNEDDKVINRYCDSIRCLERSSVRFVPPCKASRSSILLLVCVDNCVCH